MDDFIVYENYFEEALKNFEKKIIRYKEANISLRHDKCFMMFTEGIVLGHNISRNGIRLDTSKLSIPAC